MKRLALISVMGALMLAGCATPETRLRTGLIDAGLSQRVAGCMAERMVDRLSLLQLRRIDHADSSRSNIRSMTVDGGSDRGSQPRELRR